MNMVINNTAITSVFSLSMLISVAFGFLAALMAFMITYIEYEKHKFSRIRLWKECLKTAAFTFLVFLCLSLVAFYVLFKTIS